jgi:glycerophosphoryl diester phosphodiesterase
MMRLQLSKVIGHRGACSYAPENTIVSMQKAHELGLQWVEFDVMLTRCHQPIVIHDTTLNRTTNGIGEVADTDYATIAKLDAGSWFSSRYKDVKVPTFKEILACLDNLSLGINVEIKPYSGFEELTAKIVTQQLKAHWPVNNLAPLVSSFSSTVIEIVRGLDSEIALGYAIDSWEGNWEQIIEQYRCISLHVNHRMLNPQRVETIKQSGRRVLCYTVNEASRAKELFQWGVDAIFTDYPDVINSDL